ncbi:site-specific integrase [Pontimicrobium sp. IMCC45349]|uniref:site-specific integrase n=1 Tax=Pontimicrobium sp. IMCC45349 TaxID=3391574 RepID=UPI00399FACB9
MNKQKINILFLVEKSKTNKQGKCPLKCRITYLGKRKPFSTGIFIKPNLWESKFQIVKPPNSENDVINSKLSLIKQKINKAFLLLQMEEKEFDVQDVYIKYQGGKHKAEKTLQDIMTYHNNRMKKLIGIETTYTSWEKYNQTQTHISDFLWSKFKKKDYQIKDLNEKFLYDFEYYLQTEKKFKTSTIYKSIQRFRKMIRLGISRNYINKDPFMLFKAKRYKKEIVFLTTKELEKLRKHSFKQVRLQQVRDMFVFCCYTGLAYKEMANLESKHISEHFDGNLWIQMIRQKTDKPISIPLLPQAKEILARYSNEDSVLPVISNQKFNSYLKEIAELTGITKNLTHHIARKTFATTVLLYNDVPMEIVSKLLGHSKMSVTEESYGEVVQKKVSEQMKKLTKKLNRKNI